MKSYRTVISVSLIAFTCLITNAQQAISVNYTTRHGLPSNKVYSVTEDRNGFVWIATDLGASRFDGVQFTNFSSDNGLPDNDVLRVLEDSVGRIWFLNFATEPGYYYKGKIHNASNDSFLALLKRTKTNTPTVYAIDVETKQLYFRIPLGNEFQFANIDNKRTIKIGTYNGNGGISGIYMYSKPHQTVFADGFRIFINRKDSFIYFPYISRHLNGYDPINKRLAFCEQVSGKTGWVNFLDASWQYGPDSGALFIDYLASDKKLFILKKNSIHIIPQNTLKTKTINSIGFDANTAIVGRNGIVWLTNAVSGLYLARSNNTYKVKGIENDNNNVLSICKVRNKIFIGTDRKGLIEKNGDQIIRRTEYSGKNLERIVKVLPWNGSIYFGTDIGLMQLQNGKSNIVMSQNSTVKDVEMGFANELLLATASGVYRKTNSNPEDWKQLFKGRSVSICRINESQIWFGQLQGLYSCKIVDTGYLIQKVSTLTPIDFSYINDIRKDLEGNVWISTNQNGLFFYNANSGFISVKGGKGNHSPNIASLICRQIYVDSSNTIWVANAGGIARISYKMNQGKALFNIHNYTLADGLPDVGVNDINIIDGKLIIATSSGCYQYAPSLPTEFNSKTFINDIWVNGSKYENNLLDLNYTQNNIIFNFYASFIDAASSIYHFRYRVKGLTNNWVDIYSTQVPLSGLLPGNYELQIAAIGNNDQMGPVYNVPFTIHAAWYKSTIFLFACFLLLFMAAFFIIRNEKRRIEKSRNLALMELKVLRGQMKPHFIFNSLNSIQQHLLLNDFRVTSNYISKFASLLRSNLHYSALETISLKEELDFIRNYLDLEKYRFQNLFDYQIEIDESAPLDDLFLPAFMLQPLVENCIKHGFKFKKSGGVILVRFSILKSDLIRIEVIDNGSGLLEGFSIRASVNPKDSVGLSIIEQRIKILRKQKKSEDLYFQLQNREDGYGTIATLVLPLTKTE